jgi:predicted MPP superfamily phosphohydrolase
MAGRILIFLLIVIVIEVYFLQAVKTAVQDLSQSRRTTILYITYSVAGLNILLGIISIFYPPPQWHFIFRYLSAACLILVICKLIGISFLLIDDLIRLFRWIFSFIVPSRNPETGLAVHGISRLKFLSQAALALTIIPAAGFIYGMIWGAYKYRVHKVKVPSAKLPDAFDGFKIVQLSDIHTGSFVNNDALKRAFKIAQDLQPDLILFTGDLVNNEAKETEGYEEVYASLKAPYGVYSVLGNHDYGDYVHWETNEAKRDNLDRLKKVQAEAGWKLLINEHVALEKDGQKIALLGVENWGGSMHFPKYGKLDVAHRGTHEFPFKILMSHDPSHWEKQVRIDYPDIDLTLSGHTHGMQMGIEIPGFKWSPVKYLYRFWAGLYQQDQQFLYVNRGLGFLGYPGRLGIWPEITLLELKKA